MKGKYQLESIINKGLRSLAAAALLFSSSGMVQAASVGFEPSPINVKVGDVFTVNIVGREFLELAGGVIDIGFDGNLLRVVPDPVVDPYFDFLPDPGAPGGDGSSWLGIGFDTFINNPATGDFTIATVEMEALAAGVSSLTILSSSEFFSTTAQLFPDPFDGTVNIAPPSAIPVPAAVWLFGSGLLGLVGVARRKTA